MKKILFLLLSLCVLRGCSRRSGVEVPDTNGDGKLTCTLEVRCDTLLAHLDEFEKAELVPDGGVLLPERDVEFTAGDTVFDVFRKTLRAEKLHFEYTDTQIYDTVYIEGIGNLYELDCGSGSGWMFSVNDVYPSLGCSAYTLADGDAIVFRYTCDSGADLGAS